MNSNTKRILCDIDGTITEYDFNRLVKDFFGVDLSPMVIFAYDLADVLGVSKALIDTMFAETVYGKPNYIDGSYEVLSEWQAEGYEIIIFSNRVKYMGEMELAKWLIENDIPFSGIDSTGLGNYDYAIDDRPAKLADVEANIKLLYHQPWNARCYDIERQLTRVKSWDEIKGIVG